MAILHFGKSRRRPVGRVEPHFQTDALLTKVLDASLSVSVEESAVARWWFKGWKVREGKNLSFSGF